MRPPQSSGTSDRSTPALMTGREMTNAEESSKSSYSIPREGGTQIISGE